MQKQSRLIIKDDEGLQLILSPASPAGSDGSAGDLRKAAGDSGSALLGRRSGLLKAAFLGRPEESVATDAVPT
jgi:hypothetical protein